MTNYEHNGVEYALRYFGPWGLQKRLDNGKHRILRNFSSSTEEALADNPFPNLSQFLASGFEDKTTHDVTFSVDGTTVSAHRFMLMRLRYFRTMLSGSFREAASNEPIKLQFESVTAQAFSSLLAYIYTDDVDCALATATSVEQVLGVLKTAHALDVPKIVQACENKLLLELQSLTPPETLFKMLLTSHIHECSGLKQHTLQLMADSFPEIARTKKFLDFGSSYPDLYGELVDIVAARASGGVKDRKRRRK